MLPNVRLMIAATLASVVALICGFGMFAVFRVNHEPFVRLPAATAPLLLVSDNAAAAPARYALAEPFDARFQLTVERDAVEQISTIVATVDHNEQAEPSAATTTTATNAVLQESGGERTEPAGALTASTAEPSASETPTPTDAATGNAANGSAAPQPEAVAAVSASDVRAPPAMPASGPAAEVAVNTPASELSVPQPTDNATPANKRAHRPTAQKAKRLRAAVHVPRVPRVAMLLYAPPRRPRIRYAATPYAPALEQDFATTQAAFQSALSAPSEFGAGAGVPVARPRIAVRRPKEQNTAIGGPFVSATSR
jgi:hypothetical protein